MGISSRSFARGRLGKLQWAVAGQWQAGSSKREEEEKACTQCSDLKCWQLLHLAWLHGTTDVYKAADAEQQGLGKSW